MPPGAAILSSPAVGHAVLGHVTDVGDVHDVPDVVPEELERASEDVGIQEGPEFSMWA